MRRGRLGFKATAVLFMSISLLFVGSFVSFTSFYAEGIQKVDEGAVNVQQTGGHVYILWNGGYDGNRHISHIHVSSEFDEEHIIRDQDDYIHVDDDTDYTVYAVVDGDRVQIATIRNGHLVVV